MRIELTREQQDALDSEPIPHRFVDPRTHAEYILVPEKEYETLKEIIEDDRRQKAVHAIARRNAATRLNEMP